MYRYEVWYKSKWGRGGTDPENVEVTLDSAMLLAEKLSKTEPAFVLDKSQSPSKIRGFGIAGKWIDAVDNCKRCGNTGSDPSASWWQDETCKACKGTSWKPF